ncbi:MAG: glycosyltransferase family 2 protein [Planctomycetota bacterium]|nr:glycosyltransferase family 2 protein [Planctomycetota bacterium]
MIKASIIIPTYNRGKLLYDTLKNLLGHLPADVEIIVVDQSEEVHPDILEIIKSHSNVIHYYKIYVKGLPHARNYGLKRAIGEIVIFCDDDVITTRNFIQNHLRNYEEKDIGGVGGRILQQGKQRHSFSNVEYVGKENLSPYNEITPTIYSPSQGEDERRVKNLRNTPSCKLEKNDFARKHCDKETGKVRWDAYLIDNFDSNRRSYIEHVQGCNMSFRKEAIIKAGEFDERFGGSAHLEETDLCLRIRKAGYKIVFDPEAELIHLKDTKGGCRAENYKQWFYWYGHNNTLFFLKNFSRSLLPVFAISSFMRLALSACKRLNPMIVVWGIGGYWAGLASYKANQPT